MAGHLEEIFDVYGKIVDIDLPVDKKSESVSCHELRRVRQTDR